MKLSIPLAAFVGSLCATSGFAEPWALPNPSREDHPSKEVPAASPLTYPDAAGFDKRSQLLLTKLAENDLLKWRSGYFHPKGDAGKYMPGPAMAKLLLDPTNADALKYMNDERSPKEHYHFAAINWARFVPIFGSSLTPETRAALASNAAKFGAYLHPTGTENHRTMNLFAAAVLPDYLEGGKLAHKDREAALLHAKEQLRTFVKGVYAVGPGEWDSPTYLMFTLHGLLNIYDFAKDPEVRLIAAAGLDWLTAAYALKYRDGIFCGPNQRGYYDDPMDSIADQTGWLWWGSHATPKDPEGFYYAIHAATSSWRPNEVLTRIARKELPRLPVTQLDSHPNYWYGHGEAPHSGEYPETLHLSKSFTMGSLWRGFGSQITRFQLVANSPAGGVALTGGHPRKSNHKQEKQEELTFRDGGGRYDQSAQFGPLYLCLSRFPEEEPVDYTFVSIPQGVEPVKLGRLWVLRVGDAWAGIVPFTEAVSVNEIELNEKQREARKKKAAKGENPEPVPRMLRIAGRPSGFAVIAAEGERFPDAAAFARWAEEAYPLDLRNFPSGLEVRGKAEGVEFSVRYNLEGDVAEVTGIPVPPREGPVFSGPFVRVEKSVLEVRDGQEGYAVDFSGDLPSYRKIDGTIPSQETSR